MALLLLYLVVDSEKVEVGPKEESKARSNEKQPR